MSRSRSDMTNPSHKEYYLAKRDDYKNRRKDGFLHPKCYLWVMDEAFDGGLKEIPAQLETLFRGSCGAWGWWPHYHRLERWERKRFITLLTHLFGDEYETHEEAETGTESKEAE